MCFLQLQRIVILQSMIILRHKIGLKSYHKSISILQIDFSQLSEATKKFFDVAFPRSVRQSSEIYTATHA